MVPSSVSPSFNTTQSSSVSRCPLSPEIDRALLGVIDSIQGLYVRGNKREFVVLTHSNPDPDAAAGALGMKHLLRLILPGDASVRVMVSGPIGAAYSKDGRFSPEPIEHLRSLYDSERSAKETAARRNQGEV